VTAITNPVTVAQSIAANLNATVVGTGTFAVQATDNLTEVGGSAFTLGQQLAAASLPVVLTAAQIAILTPPTAAAIGTAVSGDLLIGTQLASASVPVALPTATITTLTPPTAAAIAAAIVANPPTVAVSGNVAVTQSTSPWIVAGSLTHNNAVPAGNNIGALVGIASTVAPVYGAGDQVLLSTDLAGNLRVVSSGGSGAILGPQLSSASTSVVLAIDQQIVTNIQDTVGAALFGTNNALNVHLFGNEIFNLDGQGNLGVSLTSQVLGNNTTAPATVLMVGGKTVNQVVNATWTHVQGSVTAVTTAVTATVTLTNNPSQGNLVCIGISLASASVLINEMVVKDSNGNVYMASPSSPTPIQSGSGSCWLFYLLSAPANATKTITATWTGSGSGAIWADEFHISVGTAVFDKDAVGTASGNSIFQSTTIDSPSITPTYQGSLLYSTAAPSGGTGISAPTAGAALGNWTGASGAITNGRMSEYDLSATGTTSVNYTQGTAPWVAIAMSFYAAASPSIYSYDILPLGPTGRSVLVEGVPGGTAIPISVSIQ